VYSLVSNIYYGLTKQANVYLILRFMLLGRNSFSTEPLMISTTMETILTGRNWFQTTLRYAVCASLTRPPRRILWNNKLARKFDLGCNFDKNVARPADTTFATWRAWFHTKPMEFFFVIRWGVYLFLNLIHKISSLTIFDCDLAMFYWAQSNSF
jgi:hypothetical protein